MYKKMYLLLFNAITNALKHLENGNVWDAKSILMNAQQEAEEVYISWEGSADEGDGG